LLHLAESGWRVDGVTRARALAAAVPQRVITAVAGLVLLASIGVALVLGAGLSTWQGAVSHAPAQSGGRPPSVVSPPRSAVIVVPTPRAPSARVPARPSVGEPVARTVVATLPAPAAASHRRIPAPAHAAQPAAPAVVATPRVTATPSGKHSAKHANRGKHLGWTKGARGGGHGHGAGLTHTHG